MTGAIPAESVRADLKATKENLETAKASCGQLSNSNEKLTSENLQLTTQVELQTQQLTELQKCTLGALRLLLHTTGCTCSIDCC